MRVLMVEDEPEMARLVVGKLARSGFVADRVGSLDETMEALRQHKYSLVLLDRRLPDGDAVSILPDIRRAATVDPHRDDDRAQRRRGSDRGARRRRRRLCDQALRRQ